jgi:hypothetical protein
MAAPELQFRKITFTSCCDANDILEFKYVGGNYNTLVYPNPSLPLPAGFSNTCYQVTISQVPLDEWFPLPLSSSVPSTFFSTFPDKEAECIEYVFPNGCPECNTKCYTLYNCDGLSFNSTVTGLDYYVANNQQVVISIDAQQSTWFVFENTDECIEPNNDFGIDDTPPELCVCRCFEIVLSSPNSSVTAVTYIDCDGNLITNSTATKFCSQIVPIITGTGYQVIEGDACIDGLCPEKCFKLTNCDPNITEVIYSTLQSLSQYVNTSSVVTLVGYEGCWEVEESVAVDCNCITVTIEAREESGLVTVTEHTATNIGTYNGWGVWKFTVDGDDFFISNQSINPVSSWIISITDCCANPGTTYAESKLESDCPETISDGSLTGWVIQEGNPWINVQTEKCPGPCECPADITVVEVFSSCETCEPYVAYKLQNCEKIYEVQYTTQDLSEYVDSVIETDCGCWTVIPINYVPPSETLIVIDNTFKRCNDCLSTFYRLIDCAGEVGDIVTTTDLSDYVGEVIKIENCDTCWEIETTRTFTELSNVVVVNSYKDCPECGIDLPCVCSKLTNLTLTEQVIEYVDCENNTQEITLLVGETSEKICLKKWILPELPEGHFLYAEYFGNCLQLDTTAFICPQPVFKNNRTVRPGYNTPICTPAKYDEITCRFADIMYKVVLEKRYGITNCCPDEDDRWLVQKELIDLQALKDPNYNCPDCPCSCNSGKTCSTCNCKK